MHVYKHLRETIQSFLKEQIVQDRGKLVPTDHI